MHAGSHRVCGPAPGLPEDRSRLLCQSASGGRAELRAPYGYRSVDRAIRAGLISARKLPRRWELYVTNKGKKELEMRS